VMFSDGIRPGGDLTELDGVEVAQSPVQPAGRRTKKVDKSGCTPLSQSRCVRRVYLVCDHLKCQHRIFSFCGLFLL